ncbi:hypothetical protein N7457_001565 [Penicillium paradoxum]|uniref:uncharacterized protein n=1 Tax=Penicillium paradoxum TaxID=176176 RepID=UPI002548DE6F|nr:uncharacterized protein N7457_001565 [Penicillium paradoxum]KAJ5794966.1 hypothetical protein N7457_001565 [Penicillium paradoxum]
MLGLSATVALAASGAAIFIVVSVVSIVIWVRYRNKRRALTLVGFGRQQGRRSRVLQSYPVDTLTELSQAEGNVLRAHGQLPYGKPGEWGQLTSRESLLRPMHTSESAFALTEKARSLRNSISRSRSKLSRSSHKRVSSLATVGESTQIHSPSPKASISKEEVPISAVEGILELPAENTPRQTPDPNEGGPGFHLGMRPLSPGRPLQKQRNSSSHFGMSANLGLSQVFDPSSVVFEESPRRLRGRSIASQTPGTMPDHSIPPPPPIAYPPERFSYARNDSAMRLSSMSLDTTNSSILDDGRNGPRSADTDLTSPLFPSGGSFVPFSAADVGVRDGRRSFITTNTSIPPLHRFPVRSCSTTETRHKSPSLSPRRSLTTHHSSASVDRFGGAPRRNDSMSSFNPPSRHTSQRSGASAVRSGYLNPNAPEWRSSSSQSSFTPYFNQFHNETVYEDEEMEYDPFYVGSPGNGTRFHPVESPPRKVGNTNKPASPMQTANMSVKGALPSALKGGNSQRKGHRRQNCVRISIHPPLTFGSSTFSPTVEEEPEDFDKMEELDLRESSINSPAKPPPSLPTPTTNSPLSSRRSNYGSRHGKSGLGSLGPLVEEPQPPMYDESPCKRKYSSSLSTANKLPNKNTQALPELFTSLPPSTGICLTHTPSPDQAPSIWEPHGAPSPSHENSHPISGPRRSAVKGPRTQPSIIATRSHPTGMSPISDHSLESPLSPNRLPLLMNITGTEGSDWRKSTDSLQRTRTDASRSSFRRDRDSTSSLDNGLGPIGGSSVLYGSRRSSLVQARVSIFEDANQTTSPSKQSVLSPVGSFRTPDSSPTHGENSIPRSLPPNQQLPPYLSGHYAPPTPTSPRRGMTTPTGKSLGLGIDTPASLYDGDGFLRE